MQKCGGPASAWTVGITGNPQNRLFVDHGVNRQADSWIYIPTVSAAVARNIESYFVNQLGADGGTGGGDENSNYVYAYKKRISHESLMRLIRFQRANARKEGGESRWRMAEKRVLG